MKKYAVLLLLFPSFAWAQTKKAAPISKPAAEVKVARAESAPQRFDFEKDQWMVGANLSVLTGNGANSQTDIDAEVERFLKPNLSVGGHVAYTKGNNVTYTDIGPSATFYFLRKNELNFFGRPQLMVHNQNDPVSNNYISAYLAVGANRMLGRNVGVALRAGPVFHVNGGDRFDTFVKAIGQFVILF